MNGGKIKKLIYKTLNKDTKEQNFGKSLKPNDEILLLIKEVLEKSSDAIGISDSLGHHFYQNKAFTELFEYTTEELGSIGGVRVIYADKALGNKVFNTIIGGGSWTGEAKFISKSGNIFTAQQHADAIKDDSGNVIGIIGLHKDKTKLKMIDEELYERDIRLKRLFHCVPGIIYMFTRRSDGTYCMPFATEAILDLYGCTPQDVRADISSIIKVILPEDLNKFFDSIEYSAKHMTTWTCEYRVQLPGKSVQWRFGNSTPEKKSDGSITWYGFNTDITERKMTEEAIRESEENYRSLFDYSMDAILLTRPDGSILDANPAACKMFGRSVHEIKKAGRAGLVDMTDPCLTFALKKRKILGGETAEFRMLRANGEKFPVEVSSKIFNDAKGEKKPA